MFKESVFLVAALLAAASAFHTLVKPGEELVYNYTAIIKLGVVHPSYFSSHFSLHGKLHMQTDSNGTIVAFSDLSYTLKNGKDDMLEQHGEHTLPIEEKMKDLVKPFKVVYDTTGKVIAILSHSSENEYVANMKKAIGGVLQLDISKIQMDLNGKQHSFTTDEVSIQGKVNVFYNVEPKGDKIVVTKFLDTDNHHTIHHVMTNTQKTICDVKPHYPYSQYSKRHYVIKQDKSGNKVVSEVMAQGGIDLHPFKGKEAYYLHTHQKMHLLEVKPVQQEMVPVGDRYESAISNTLHTEGYSKGLKETIDQQQLKSEVIRTLGKAMDYLHEDHMHMDTPDAMKGQMINKMKSMLSMCDLPVLQQIHETLKQKTSQRDLQMLELYYQMLPFVGSRASLQHIKQLITQKKVKDNVAIHMLQEMPLYVKAPTHEVVTEMEDLISLDGSSGVRKTAILSFSILVNKAYKFDKSYEHHEIDIQEVHHDMREHHETDSSVYDKYVHSFVSMLRATNDFAKQKLYLEALYNMRLKSVYKYLEPAIEGKWFDSDDFRLRALWAVVPLIQDQPQKVFSWYWPILSDTSKLTEHRVEAFYAIMHSQPETVHLMDIAWMMKTETNKELYHVFYTYVQAMMRTTSHCAQHFRTRVTEIFSSLPKLDKQSVSGFYLADFHDREFDFGGGMSALVLSTNTTKVVHGSVTTEVFNPRSYTYGFWLKVVGLESGLTDKFLLNTQSTSKVFNWQEVLHILTSIPNNNHIHIEGSMTKDSYVVDGFFYDGSNINELLHIFNFFNADHYNYIKESIDVDYDPDTRIMLTTDMGIPAVIDFMVPIVHKHNINVTKEHSDKIMNMNIDFHWKMWSHGTYGIRLFNPMANVKQQVMKYMMFDAVLPIHVDVTTNMQQQKMKVTWKVPSEQEGNVIGFRSHTTPAVATMNYVGEHVLQRSSPKDEDVVFATHGHEYRHNYTVSKHEVNTGYHFLGAIYDTDPENYVTNGGFWSEIMKIVFGTPEHHSTPIDFIVNTVRHLYTNAFLQPSVMGMRGLMLKLSPSAEIPITHLDLSLRTSQEMQRDEKLFTPKVSFNSRATYSAKNMDRAMRTWDVNANVDLNSGHTDNNLKMQVTRIVPGQKDYKICVDGTVKYMVENITGHVTVATTQSSESKCTADDTMMDITVDGHKTEEQHKDHVVYGLCSYPLNRFLEPDYTLPCIAAHTTMREFIYDVKTMNVPSEFKKTAMHLFDYVKGMYMSHYTHIPEHQEDVAENNLRVKVEFPVVGDQMNVEVVSHQQGWKLESVPIHDLPMLGGVGVPESTYFSDMLMFMHSVGLMDVCVIHKDDVHHHHHSIQQHMTNDWELYWGDKVQNPYVGVYVKEMGGKMAMKLIHKTHVLEIQPDGDHYKMVLNGQDVSEHQHLFEEWMYLIVKHKTAQDSNGPVYMVVPDTGLLVKYDIHTIKVEMPKFDAHFKGHCADKV